MIVIDGSHGEGGGQVLRSALTLAVLTGQHTRIERIRAGRSKPGLRPQHLTAVRAAAAVCQARTEGDRLGSQMLTFAPGGPPQPGDYRFDVAEAAPGGSAGSVSLVLQTVLLPLGLTRAPCHLTLRGGTHAPWAPPVPYLEHVFAPRLEEMGIQLRIELDRWGFYPAGGGEVSAHVVGQKEAVSAIQLIDRGDLQRVWGTAAVTNLPSHIPQRMAARARNVLEEAGLDAHIEAKRLRGAGPGAGIFLFAQYANVTAGFAAHGRKGLPSERVAEEVCRRLLDHHRSGAPADPHLADQLVLPMALADGDSQVATSQISQHLLTNVWVVRQFLSRELVIGGEVGTAGTLIVRGNAHD